MMPLKKLLKPFSRKKVDNGPCKENHATDPLSKVSVTSNESSVYDDEIGGSLDGSIESPVVIKSATSILMGNLSTKTVRFSEELNQWNVVEPYLAHSSDLWWSKDEVMQRRKDVDTTLREYTDEELRGIREYTQTYQRCRRQAVVTKKIDSSVPNSRRSNVSLSREDYQIIVRGKACGFDGMEVILAMIGTNSNAECAREIVRSIVLAYRNHSKHGKADYGAMRSFARSLTSADRSWAVVMAAADRDALGLPLNDP